MSLCRATNAKDASSLAAVATNEGKPEESAPWATILLAARRLETGKLTGDAQ